MAVAAYDYATIGVAADVVADAAASSSLSIRHILIVLQLKVPRFVSEAGAVHLVFPIGQERISQSPWQRSRTPPTVIVFVEVFGDEIAHSLVQVWIN